MSLGDFWQVSGPVSVIRFQTKAGQTAIKAGEPVIQDTSGDVEYVQAPGANVTTSDTFVGFAVTADTVTTSNDGVVDVAVPSAGSVFRGRAHTAANLATTVILTKVVIDFTSPAYKVDEDLTTNGFLQIVGYDANMGFVDFIIDMTELVNA